MNIRDYYDLFKYLMEQYCLFPDDLIYVENIADWCREQGIAETDEERLLKLVAKDGGGCIMVIREYVSDKIMEERINALRIRG